MPGQADLRPVQWHIFQNAPPGYGDCAADPKNPNLTDPVRPTGRNLDDAAAWETTGTLLLKRRAFGEARACFLEALRVDPDRVTAVNNLAIALEGLGRFHEAEGHYRALLSGVSGDAAIMLNFAVLLGRLGKHSEAFGLVQNVIQQSPGLTRAHLVASALACDLGRFAEGLVCIDNAISLSPQETSLKIRRADILRQLGRSEEALAACDQILYLLPHDPHSLQVKALTLRTLGRAQEALDLMEQVQESHPAPAKLVSDKGWILAEFGCAKEALQAFDRALELQPDLSHAWYGRSLLKRYRACDPDIRCMEDLLGRDLANRDRINLSFALGKAYLELRNGDDAFRHLNEGNALKRMDFHYSVRADRARIERIAGNFTADLFSRSIGASGERIRPIFIFGMPRSGTTLVEQILVSHPLIASIGEAGHVGHVAAGLAIGPDAVQASPDSIISNLAAFRERYFSLAKERIGEKTCFVDKMPTNFLNLGVIALAFPEAPLIHCRRNPLDTCLSCYATLFTYGHEYSYDQTELGQYYGHYRRLMGHWQRILPENRILALDYEALVTDSESQMRRILDFCGLAWDANCLKFYETKRHVPTASFNQVRSPIYKTSLGRAELFRPYLKPLATALKTDALAA